MNDTGQVESLKDGIILASGLSDVGMNELVEIFTADFQVINGLVVELAEAEVGIVVLGEFQGIRSGDAIKSTGKVPCLAINDNFLGRVLDALGKPIDGKGEVNSIDSVEMPLEKIAPGVVERQDVERPLETGVMAIDALIPIGRGQRQLIIGDRQTGKTALAVDTMLNLKDKNCVSVYVSIGQKVSKLSQLVRKLEERGALTNTVIISAPVSTSAAMQYLAAYTGTAIGKYFAESGRDAVVIYDDLSKHSQAYREISLLLGRPSGRDAYPGDIFYLHSRLLERSIQYNKDNGGGSLTALPIIETQAGDISSYIPTNVISITDGQIFLDSTLFNTGQRPAISIGTSVSRVGGSAQTKVTKQVAGQLKLDLAQYRELAAFAQFGSDLDSATKQRLNKGAKAMEVLKQPENEPKTQTEMVLTLFALNNGLLDEIEKSDLLSWVSILKQELKTNSQSILLNPNEKLEGKTKSTIEKFLKDVTNKFAILKA